ncbi:LOW QUALITY PROTEIN: hypothetical protein OSB04_012725 [Centaurea solstitialis]|uniref:Uncharacterized protein n=1 Tax=Centaurea solstitialis TaxID=347529 RepID=A0AA38WQU3_9ASTR|nr:LOW QUALITY PROTEIN: hypothetical protein OSB04_012725 [Centaurea solstitialis]
MFNNFQPFLHWRKLVFRISNPNNLTANIKRPFFLYMLHDGAQQERSEGEGSPLVFARMNFVQQGYVLSNPRTFAAEQNFGIRFANGMGLISDELYKSLFHSCHGEYRPAYISPNNIACLQNLEWYQQCMDGILEVNILEIDCSDFSSIKLPSHRLKVQQPLSKIYCYFLYSNPYSQKPFQRNESYNKFWRTVYMMQDELNSLMTYWANDGSVREALHIRKGSKVDWIRCNKENFTTVLDDVRDYHLNLSKKGYRSLIFSGDQDMTIPHQSTQLWIKELNYSVTDQWRSWKIRGQIAG